MNRESCLQLLRKYNTEPFHILHALTVEGTMRYYANELGYGDAVEFWGLVGLMHDIDFGSYPMEHCTKAPVLLAEINAPSDMVHAVCSHGYGMTGTECKPEHIMEKVLFAVDELTGLIGASVRMRPSKSVMDMEVSSLKKKFKDKHFAAGCSRDVIAQGAQMLNWTIEELFEKTIMAMRSCEEKVNIEFAMLCKQ
jgi:predicted hydrolase (HD superfamily)